MPTITDAHRDPVIVDLVRTPFGRRGGQVSGLHAAELLGTVQVAALQRLDLDPQTVEQVIGGCVTPVGEQYGNVVRTSWLHAGLPPKPGFTTIEAMCGTAQQAVHLIAGQIALGALEIGMACGVELMSRVPLTAKEGLGFGTARPASWALQTPDQFTAADRIANKRGFTRDDLDAYGLRSQQLARAAWDANKFARQVIPIQVPTDGGVVTVRRDEGLRDTSLEALAKLTPVKEGGYHTAGTSSQVSDGASAAVLMSRARAEALGHAPRGRMITQAVISGDLEFMLDGPAEIAGLLLERAGMTMADIDYIEVNEAFAAIPMSFAKVHDVDPATFNSLGGAIAVGHPAGATGIRLIANVLEELERRDANVGMVAICAAAATTGLIIERL